MSYGKYMTNLSTQVIWQIYEEHIKYSSHMANTWRTQCTQVIWQIIY